LTNVNGTLFFTADDGSHGRELWKLDGTTANLVKDIHSGDSSHPRWLVNVGGILFFTANDGTNGRELWMSDGTEANTLLVKDI
jgi:ELWxxDGT repeat protein